MANPVYGTDWNSLKKQTLQLAPEATAGTPATTGFKRLHGLSLDASPQFETEVTAPRGARFAALQETKKEWAQAGLSGKPDFNEIDFPLASVICKPTKTGTGPSYTRVYELLNTAAAGEAQQTYTLQQGDANLCETYAYGLMQDYQLVFDREAGISQSGNMRFRAVDTATALVTAGVTDIAISPMRGSGVDIWVADTPAGLASAGNKVLLPWAYTWGINSRADDYWALNTEFSGPAFFAEGESQGFAGSLKVPTKWGLPKFLANIRANSLVYIRVKVLGKKIDTGPDVYESLQIDQCWFVQNIPTDNQKAAYSKTIELVGAQSDDATWKKSVEITLVNGIV